MSMFFNGDEDEDYNDHLEDELRKKIKTTRQRMKEAAVRDFIDGCYKAYDALVNRGEEAMQEGDETEIKKAFSRMMAFFLYKEEYEKCGFLKEFSSKYFPGHEINPDWEVIEDMKEVKGWQH